MWWQIDWFPWPDWVWSHDFPRNTLCISLDYPFIFPFLSFFFCFFVFLFICLVNLVLFGLSLNFNMFVSSLSSIYHCTSTYIHTHLTLWPSISIIARVDFRAKLVLRRISIIRCLLFLPFHALCTPQCSSFYLLTLPCTSRY